MKTPITKEGHARLGAELETLKAKDRPAIIAAIAEARAHGDLSENAEYHSAKERQGFIEARIKLLESVIGGSDIFDPATAGADGRCIFGAWVRVEDDNEKKIEYRLVSEHEANIAEGLLSVTSPIGRALLGKYAGDSVAVQTPGGEREYEILNIRYQ